MQATESFTESPPNAAEYGAYIWPAYGVALVILACLGIAAFRRLRRVQ